MRRRMRTKTRISDSMTNRSVLLDPFQGLEKMSETYEPGKPYDIKVTPQMAKKWLVQNTSNRPISASTLNGMIRDLQNGKFDYNGESIKIATDGRIIDGQHRLEACVQSGISFRTVVVFGLPFEVQGSIDVGNPRKYSHQLALRGVANAETVASIVRRIALWNSNVYFSRGGRRAKPTRPELDALLNQFSVQIEKAAQFAEAHAKGVGVAKSIIGLTHFIFSRHSIEDADDFLTKVSTGENMEYDHPAMALRRRIVNEKEKVGVGHRINEESMTACFIIAWNAYRKGNRIARVQLPRGRLNSDNFPKPR